ncbi:MAG: ABC transporter substrate-binding protein [Armatimonadota bacterium]
MHRRDLLTTLFGAGLALPLLGGCSGGGSAGDLPKVGVVAYGPDPTTDITVEGLKEGLRAAGFEPGKAVQVEYQDAQGDQSLIPQIVQKYVSEGVRVIVPMTTPCLVATANALKNSDQPVVFTEVFNPYAAGVARSSTDHPANLTGVASPPPAKELLDLILELQPQAKTIGTIYNAGEANSVSAVERLREAAAAGGLKLVERTVAGSIEVQQAAQSLVEEVAAVCIPGDNTVQAALDALVGPAQKARVPVVAGNPAWIEQGMLACLGPDFRNAGKEAGEMVAAVLNGESPAGMPIRETEKQELLLNRKVATALGIAFSEALAARADRVIE